MPGQQDKGPQERENGGYFPVGQSRKTSGGKNVQAAEQKAEGKDPKTIVRDFIDPGCIFCEQPQDTGAAKHGNREDQQGCRRDKLHADGEDSLLPDPISVSIVKADHRSDSHGVADIQGVQQKLRVNHDGDGGDPIFPQQVHHGLVEQEGGDGGRQLAYHFRRTVETAFSDDRPF